MTVHSSIAPARAYRDSAAELVERFVPMVRKLAWHLHASAGPDIEAEDLIQTGFIALTECAQRHEGSVSGSFAAYAKIRVKGAMVDQLRRAAPISRGAARRRREIADTENRLRARLGREPSHAEIAEALKLEPDAFEAMRTASEPIHFESIDDSYSDSDMTFCEPSDDALALLVSEENRAALIEAIADLPERLQLVIQLYFIEELNLSEIAAILGVTVPRVHQLKDQALNRIRKTMLEEEAG